MAGILLVCLAASLWGTVGVANSLMTGPDTVDPVVVGLSRTVLGAFTLLVAASVSGLPSPGWRRLPLGRIAIFGLAGATFQICLFAAFREVSVTVTVAVTVCAPVLIVALGEALWRRAAPDGQIALGVLLAASGVFLAMPGAEDAADTLLDVDLYGFALLAGASLSFAVLAVVTRTITRDLHPLRAAGFGLATSALVLAAVLALHPGFAEVSAILRLPGRDIALLAYIGIAATGGAYLAFVLGMHLCTSPAAGLAATLIEPGIAALLSALILREILSDAEIGGCALMMIATVLLSMAERRRSALAKPLLSRDMETISVMPVVTDRTRARGPE